jgi:tetratricopeptide (TPR) repeat protein
MLALELENLGVAQSFHQKSLEYRRRLLHMPITDPQLTPEKVKQSLGGAYSIQTALALMLGDSVKAWDFLSQMIELEQSKQYSSPRELLNDLQAQKLPATYERVAFLIRVGDISFRLNDIETCRAFYERALNRSRAAMAKAPERADVRAAMASSSGSTGDLHLWLGQPDQAVSHYTTALELVTALAAEDPDNAGRQRFLSMSHYRLATAKLMDGDSDAARKHYEDCLSVRQKLADSDPRNVHKQIDLMVALARCGKHAQAAEVAEKLDSTAQDPSVLFQIACGYALCIPALEQENGPGSVSDEDRARQEDYAARAVAAVREAVEKGYRDRIALERDPDLEPLQSRADFQAIIATMK